MRAVPVFTVFIAGDPAGQPRARTQIITPKGGGRAFAHHYTPKQGDGWRSMVSVAMYGKVRAPIEGPVHVHITALFDRPERLLRKSSPKERLPHTSKPDKDNVEKLILDVMKKAGVFKDDAQVCGGGTFKFYAAIGEKPGAEVRLERLELDESIPFTPAS